tara:strand:+ start:22554 stop:23402 length:849 start_codon:yes stop_codon:yes gene_type:complete
MKGITFSFVCCFSTLGLWQLNVLTNQSINAVSDSINYLGDVTNKGFKYTLTFFENSHERHLYNLKKEKEKSDLQRKIRIENLENVLEETDLVIEKGLPNYYKFLEMFGHNIYSQYEFAYQILLLKETLFVSESLIILSEIIKKNLEEQFKLVNMDTIVNKMIEKNIYNDIVFSIQLQQMNNIYNEESDSLYILKDSIYTYETSWNMNLSNEFFKLASIQNTNLSYISVNYIPNTMTLDFNDIHKSPKKNIYFDTTQDNYQDPKCYNKPPLRESIWNKHNFKL